MPEFSGRDPNVFDRLVEHALDAVIVLDAAERVLYASPAVERTLGYTPDELIRTDLLGYVHPDDVDRAAQFLAVRMATPGATPPVEWRVRDAAGAYRVLEIVGTNMLGDPHVGAIVLNLRDITGWDATRRAWRESESRYRGFVDLHPHGIFRFELNPPVPTSLPVDDQIAQWYERATLAEANPAARTMLGRITSDELTGARLGELLPPEDPASWELLRAFATSDFRATDVPTRQRQPDGTERWYRTDLFGLVEHGLLHAVWGVRRDVTQHEVTDELLQRSEAHLRRVLEQAPAIVWTTDASLRFTVGMGAGLRALGVGPDDLLGAPIGEYFVARGEDVDALEPHRAALRGETRQYEAEWGQRAFIVHVRPLRDADDAIVGTIGIALDITDVRRREHQWVQSEKMDAIGQLTGGIAHDFNNLLTVILTNAELLASEMATDAPEALADLSEIRSAAQRGSEMVKKLLGFGRRDMLSLRPLRVTEILATASETMRSVLPESVAVDVEPADENLVVHADPAAIEQILVNLATNARDAMPQGGTLAVRARSVAPAGHAAAMVEIVVEDSGEGMAPGVLERAFEPFFTTKAPGEGSGLGLAMIYGLVRQHGGTVELQSASGAGTTAVIRLPLMHAGVVVSGNGGRQDAPCPNGGAGTVLLAEDEAAIRSAARRLLERNGYRVIEAADGAEALEHFQRHEGDVDLIICDVVMPRLGGREVLDALRRRGKSVPFLLMSGHTGRGGVAADALEPGIPYLPKPWTASELLGQVRRLVDTDLT